MDNRSSKLLLSIVPLCSFPVIMCRELKPSPTLLERLKLEGEGATNCWDSLFELQSCSGEIFPFFLNGETYLCPSCCNAFRTIQHHGSVGVNDEESDILLGYCDASDESGSTTTHPRPPSPPQTPKPITNTTSFHVINP